MASLNLGKFVIDRRDIKVALMAGFIGCLFRVAGIAALPPGKVSKVIGRMAFPRFFFRNPNLPERDVAACENSDDLARLLKIISKALSVTGYKTGPKSRFVSALVSYVVLSRLGYRVEMSVGVDMNPNPLCKTAWVTQGESVLVGREEDYTKYQPA